MKFTIKKETGYNPNYCGVTIKASADGVILKDALNALLTFKDTDFLNKAFEQNNVSLMAKCGHYYHPLGNISKNMFEQFKAFQK